MRVFKYRFGGLVVPGAMILLWLGVLAFFLVVVWHACPTTWWSIRFTIGPVLASSLAAWATWARYPTALEIDEERVTFRYLGGRRIVVPRSDVTFRWPRERTVNGTIRGRFVDSFTIVLSQLEDSEAFVEFLARSSMTRSPR